MVKFASGSGKMAKYKMITINEEADVLADTVINIIEWDGVTIYTPPANTRLELVVE